MSTTTQMSTTTDNEMSTTTENKMLTTTENKKTFATFHTATKCLPQELVDQIVQLATRGSSPLGARNAQYPALAATCRSFRQAALNQRIDVPCPPYQSSSHHVPRSLPRWVDRTTQMIPRDRRPQLGQSLYFPDLKSLIDFFEDGPGRMHSNHNRNCAQCDQMPALNTLQDVKYISVCYVDNQDSAPRNCTHRLAYEAFEVLVYNLHQMQLERLRIRFHGNREVRDIDAPGIWSLLKIRNLPTLILDGLRSWVDPQIRRTLQGRTQWASSRRWMPLGSENPGPTDWRERVKGTQAQYTWLDKRYRIRQHDGLRRTRNLAARASSLTRLAESSGPPRRGESLRALQNGVSIADLRINSARSAREEAERSKALANAQSLVWTQRNVLLRNFTLNQTRGASAARF